MPHTHNKVSRDEKHRRLICNGVPPEGGSLWGRGRTATALPDYRIDIETGCWEWLKHRNAQRRNYPWTNCGPAARLYYESAHGGERLPSDVDVHHLCKNIGCVNPDHLEAIHGMTHRMAHFLERTDLTPEKVREIRELGGNPEYSNTRICEMFGICDKTLWSLLNGKRWAQWGGPIAIRHYTHCLTCGAELTGRRDQRFCSDACYEPLKRQQGKERKARRRAEKAMLREAA